MANLGMAELVDRLCEAGADESWEEVQIELASRGVDQEELLASLSRSLSPVSPPSALVVSIDLARMFEEVMPRTVRKSDSSNTWYLSEGSLGVEDRLTTEELRGWIGRRFEEALDSLRMRLGARKENSLDLLGPDGWNPLIEAFLARRLGLPPSASGEPLARLAEEVRAYLGDQNASMVRPGIVVEGERLVLKGEGLGVS